MMKLVAYLALVSCCLAAPLLSSGDEKLRVNDPDPETVVVQPRRTVYIINSDGLPFNERRMAEQLPWDQILGPLLMSGLPNEEIVPSSTNTTTAESVVQQVTQPEISPSTTADISSTPTELTESSEANALSSSTTTVASNEAILSSSTTTTTTTTTDGSNVQETTPITETTSSTMSNTASSTSTEGGP